MAAGGRRAAALRSVSRFTEWSRGSSDRDPRGTRRFRGSRRDKGFSTRDPFEASSQSAQDQTGNASPQQRRVGKDSGWTSGLKFLRISELDHGEDCSGPRTGRFSILPLGDGDAQRGGTRTRTRMEPHCSSCLASWCCVETVFICSAQLSRRLVSPMRPGGSMHVRSAVIPLGKYTYFQGSCARAHGQAVRIKGQGRQLGE